ncbi:MAG: hypothetical protein EPN82_16340 [Bacteroidetes bacterium]|nr:MAG: hypothetical protein EPN82_16340 [Bacteroidota bacterium]
MEKSNKKHLVALIEVILLIFGISFEKLIELYNENQNDNNETVLVITKDGHTETNNNYPSPFSNTGNAVTSPTGTNGTSGVENNDIFPYGIIGTE